MDITKEIAKIKAEVGEEIFAKIKTSLNGIESGVNEAIGDAKRFSAESRERKIKIRELEETIDNSGLDKDSYEKKLAAKDEEITRLKGFETKFNEYQTKSDSEVVENWKTKAKVFDLKDTNPNHERITKLKESFAFDEELTIEQTRKNLETYAIMETVGAFKDVKFEVKDGERFENQRQQSAEDDPLSAFDN